MNEQETIRLHEINQQWQQEYEDGTTIFAFYPWLERKYLQLEDRHHQHTYCAYCCKESLADGEDAIDEIEKHIWSCENHPLQRLCHYIEEKCKDLDFEAQELLMTGKETDLNRASAIHMSIDAIREAINDAKRFRVSLGINNEI